MLIIFDSRKCVRYVVTFQTIAVIEVDLSEHQSQVFKKVSKKSDTSSVIISLQNSLIIIIA